MLRHLHVADCVPAVNASELEMTEAEVRQRIANLERQRDVLYARALREHDLDLRDAADDAQREIDLEYGYLRSLSPMPVPAVESIQWRDLAASMGRGDVNAAYVMGLVYSLPR